MLMSIASEAEFKRMADMIRRDDPALRTVLLEADGRYATRTIRFDILMREVIACLAEGFRCRSTDDLPTLYCAWGKARVGSTALANMFGFAGMTSYYQPVKAIMRQRLKGEAGVPLILPPTSANPCAFSKETAGPYMLAECLMIPFEALVEAGYPADKLSLIVLDREPLSSLASWIDRLTCRIPESVLVRHYVLSALNKIRVENYAQRLGVPVTHYVHEASKEPVASARALFARLGLSHLFNEHAVTNWNEARQLETGNAKVIFPTEPQIYDVPGLHGSGTAYQYRAGGALSAENREIIERFGIDEVYRESAQACAHDLRMSAAMAARLFETEASTTRHLEVAE